MNPWRRGWVGALLAATTIIGGCTVGNSDATNDETHDRSAEDDDPVAEIMQTRTAHYDLTGDVLTRSDVGMGPPPRRTMTIRTDGGRDDLFAVTVDLPGGETMEIAANTIFIQTYDYDSDPDEVAILYLRRSFAELDDAYQHLVEVAPNLGVDSTALAQWRERAEQHTTDEGAIGMLPQVWYRDEKYGHVTWGVEADVFANDGEVGVIHSFRLVELDPD